MEKYREMALNSGAVQALLIGPGDLVFDKRALLKCRWGCEFNGLADSQKCGNRGLGFEKGREMITAYKHIMVVHAHDARQLSLTLLEIERQAFLDGLYFSFTLRACNFCKKCQVEVGRECIDPVKIRPCEQAFGLDVYKTVNNLGLPCYPLRNKDEQQNRYGFALLD